MPTSRHLRPADYRVMPWKNGLGTTTEIVVDPPGAALDAFTWRVSIADLTVSGPFSAFPGCDRILLQIEGAPMTLTHLDGTDREPHRLARLAPYAFPGELATHGALDAPPARDLNVMVRRDRARAEVAVHRLAPGAAASAQGEPATRVVYVLAGSATVEHDGGACSLRASETFLVEEAARIDLQASAEGATVIVIVIAIRPPPPSSRRAP